MRLLFKQRAFSWFDSYDIFNEHGETVFTVEGQLSWGKCLHILNAAGEHIGTVEQKVLAFLPQFELYAHGEYLGNLRKEFTFFMPKFTLDCSDWEVEGSFPEWDYTIRSASRGLVAMISKEPLNWTDTYEINVFDQQDALCALMVVLAIDAEKASRN